MSVRIYLDKEETEELKEKLKQFEENSKEKRREYLFMDVDIDDIDHDDLENENWYEDRFGDNLNQNDIDDAREEGYNDGFEDGKEKIENNINNDFLVLRDMFAVGKTDKDIIERLKKILIDKGLN